MVASPRPWNSRWKSGKPVDGLKDSTTPLNVNGARPVNKEPFGISVAWPPLSTKVPLLRYDADSKQLHDGSRNVSVNEPSVHVARLDTSKGEPATSGPGGCGRDTSSPPIVPCTGD